MEKRIYPAVFHREEDGAYTVTFPDLPGCITCGDTAEQAYRMAKDALALWLFDEKPAKATPFEDIRAEGGDRVMLVEEGESDGIIVNAQNDNVADVMREGLKKSGLTQYRLAKILGVDRSYVSRLVKGEKTPSPGLAQRIGALLNIDWTLFYKGSQS